MRGHIRFNTESDEARFDEQTGLWTLKSGEQSFEANVLAAGTGQLHRPAWPSIPGRESFQGESWHSAQWNHSVDLKGKRIGVIGNGASAIQFVPEIAKLDAKYIHKPWEAPAKMLADAGVELGETYPDPIVDHGTARNRALAAYRKMKGDS